MSAYRRRARHHLPGFPVCCPVLPSRPGRRSAGATRSGDSAAVCGGLFDRQAADAVRGRIDWKYALGLSLTDPGFDHTVLSEFRSRQVEGKAERLSLDALLKRLEECDLVKARDSSVPTPRMFSPTFASSIDWNGSARPCLRRWRVMAPEWLQALAPADWYERYGRRVENYRLPKTDAARLEYATTIGADGHHLLTAIDAAKDQPWLTELPAVRVLRQVWEAQYIEEAGQLRWRSKAEMPPPAEQVCSPYDPAARYSTKQTFPGLATRSISPRPAILRRSTSSPTLRPRPLRLQTTTWWWWLSCTSR